MRKATGAFRIFSDARSAPLDGAGLRFSLDCDGPQIVLTPSQEGEEEEEYVDDEHIEDDDGNDDLENMDCLEEEP